MNRIRTNSENALKQSYTMKHNNDDATDETEPTTEIEDEMVSGVVVRAVTEDVIGLVAAVENIPREELLQGDVEEVQALAREVATSISAEEAVEAMKHPAFSPDDDGADVADDPLGKPGDDDGGMFADGGEADEGGEAKANYAGVAGRVDRTNYDDSSPDGDEVSSGTLTDYERRQRGESAEEARGDGPSSGTLSDWQKAREGAERPASPREKREQELEDARQQRLSAARKDAARRERDGE